MSPTAEYFEGTELLVDSAGVPNLTTELIDLGARVLDAVLSWPVWSHRKVESLDLLAGAKGRRRVSIDCTPPRIGWPYSHEGEGSYSTAVPVTLMAKQTLRDLDVTDDSGRSIPILGSKSNGVLSAAAMAFVLFVKFGESEERTADYWTRLYAVATKPPDDAVPLVEALLSEIGLDEVVARLFRDFSACFLLTILLPKKRVNNRLVVKYSYHWEISPIQSLARRALAGFGLQAYEVGVELGALYSTSSYHLECAVPSGLIASRITLPEDRSGVQGQVDGDTQVAHANGRYDFTTDRTERVRIKFDLDRSMLLPRVLLSAGGVCALFVLMLALSWVYGTLVEQRDAATALLLFIPAFIVALNARNAENVLVGGLLLPLRVYSIGLALTLFISGGMVVLDVNESMTRGWWLVCACYSGLGFLATFCGYIRLTVGRTR